MNLGHTAPWCERIYRAKAAELILYGRALGLGHGEAEDVLQETFMSLLRLDTPPDEPERYCVRSFRNRALNHRRSFWRRLTREWESVRWFERAPSETEEERAAVRCLSELPVLQREVIVLKIWHEYTFEEIGDLLGISPNTAAGRYRYGLEKLRARVCAALSPLSKRPLGEGDGGGRGRTFTKGKNYERDEPLGDAVAFLDPAPPVA